MAATTKKTTKNNISMLIGEKGGVGKSFGAALLIDKLLNEDKRVVVIDADQSNADIYRDFSGVMTNSSLKKEVPEEIDVYSFNLDIDDGWLNLYDLMNMHKDQDVHIVISMPARIDAMMKDQRREFKRSLELLGYNLNLIWMLSEKLDSIQLLKHVFIGNEALISKLIIVKNGYCIDEQGFLHWDNSNLKNELLMNKNHVEVFLPKLKHQLKLAVEELKLPYSQAMTSNELQFSARIGLEFWLEDARAIFSSIS